VKRPDGLLPDRVRLDWLVGDVRGLLRLAAADLAAAGLVRDAIGTERALVERESVQTTALGAGIAIPHARTDRCDAPRFLAARLGMAIDFDSPDGIPVDLVFVLVGPTDDPAAHVKQLGRLARLLQRPGFAQALRTAPDEEAFRRVFELEAAAA